MQDSKSIPTEEDWKWPENQCPYDHTLGEDYSLNNGPSDGASSFLGLIKEKLVWLPSYIVPIMPELLPVLEFIGANQALYQADEDIYGSFADLVNEIKTLYAKQTQ